MSESRGNRPGELGYDEPVFDPVEESALDDEPVFSPVEPEQSPALDMEPVFEAVPAQTRGVALPVDAAHSQVGWETDQAQPQRNQKRNQKSAGLPGWLQPSHPLWRAVAAMAIVLLIALWLSFGRSGNDGADAPGEPSAGVVGSVLIRQPEEQEQPPAQAEPEPEPTPAARLSPGMNVAVGNTGGQGIRLRSAPGTASLTLGVYNDGAPFLVLSPGGDYDSYPVEADGYFWYRIRVIEDPADQLVGWAAGDFLVEREQQ